MGTANRPAVKVEGQVQEWQAHVGAHASDADAFGTRADGSALRLRGTVSDPPAGIGRSFDLSVRAGAPNVGRRELRSVGILLGTRKVLDGHVTLTAAEYQTVLALAASGKLRSCALVFQARRRGRGLILSIVFGT